MPAKKPKKDWSSINKRIKNRKKKFKADDRIFTPTFNDKNQAKVIMRMLDSKDTELPYAEQAGHFFTDVGGWFIDNCPSSIGEECPVCQDLYDHNYYETDNDLYYDRKKNTYFYTNVLIVEDKNCRENEGKVFLLKFGAKIMEKVDGAIDDDKLIWDDEDGVNFIYSAKKKGKMSNYDASYFSDAVTNIEEYGNPKEILELRHDLGTFTEASEYKSAEELKKKYLKVIGEDSDTPSKPKRTRKVQGDEVEDEEILDDDVDGDIGDEDMYSESDDDGDDDAFFDDLEDDDEDEDK